MIFVHHRIMFQIKGKMIFAHHQLLDLSFDFGCHYRGIETIVCDLCT